MGINLFSQKKSSKPKDLDTISVARKVTITEIPKNGRCPIPKGLVKNKQQSTPPQPSRNAPKAPPQKTTLTDVSDFLAPTKAPEPPQTPLSARDSALRQSLPPPFEVPAPEPPQGPYLRLLIGSQDPSSRYKTQQVFQIRPYLVKNSQVLSQIPSHEIPPGSSSSSSSPPPATPLPNLDPQAFDLYLRYQPLGPHSHLRALPELKASWRECWPLINAHILGTAIQDAGFADLMLDVVAEKLHAKRCADHETIRHVFSARGISPELKALLVDRCLEADAEGIAGARFELLPRAFVDMALQTALGRLRGEDAREEGACRYHSHGERGEECYKVRAAARRSKQESKREAASNGSGEAVGEPKKNSVHWDDAVGMINGRSSKAGSRLSIVEEAGEGPVTNGNLAGESRGTDTNDVAMVEAPVIVNGDHSVPKTNGVKGDSRENGTADESDSPGNEGSFGPSKDDLEQIIQSSKCPGSYPEST
ncbi:hypothetical protein K505DRAFT_343693 [Melanomma pulvis-pyrius CBS 109.77]|uniref:Uncharacterized protein n=1 Tax=Melanomma pulvis-pyrius CBS 109.77 TaxID=1314802 RepID=A0A6A6WR51_9PLEO|nr:hypothetical protein K505DRAFT_343693 [Melanomma pulvis-pyrius CBS 109.77]